MTRQLSSAFFGDKLLTENLHLRITQDGGEYTEEDIGLVFQSSICWLNGSLQPLFTQFVLSAVRQHRHLPFQQFSSAIEIAAHVFQHTFDHHLSQSQSFRYFTDVLVRHSLFRPPHSVSVFSEEQVQAFTVFWQTQFLRYYSCYQECFGEELNETLLAVALPGAGGEEEELRGGKLAEKEGVLSLLKQ